VREGLLEIVTRAALAEKEVLVQRLRVEGVRLGTLTVGRAGHMGKAAATFFQNIAYCDSLPVSCAQTSQGLLCFLVVAK